MGAVRIVDDKKPEFLETVISDNGHSTDGLISMLQDIQSEYHYLPEESLRHVAKSLDLPLIQVYGVATFFKAFSLKPKGKHQCAVCTGTACHVRGAGGVLEEFERKLDIEAGETTDDMEYSLETVNCVGACALGPMVIIDGEYYGLMNSGKVKKTLKDHATKAAGKAARKSKRKKKRAPRSPEPQRFPDNLGTV